MFIVIFMHCRGLFLAMVFALVWIIIMRWIAGFMVWFTIFAFLGLFGFCKTFSIGHLLYELSLFNTDLD